LRAGVSHADPIQRWNADLDNLATKHRHRPFKQLGGGRWRAATAGLRSGGWQKARY
jgi:hypothetical protein